MFCLELGLGLKLGFSVRVMVSASPRVRSRFWCMVLARFCF